MCVLANLLTIIIENDKKCKQNNKKIEIAGLFALPV